jgi:hypothetical protein
MIYRGTKRAIDAWRRHQGLPYQVSSVGMKKPIKPDPGEAHFKTTISRAGPELVSRVIMSTSYKQHKG